MTPQSHAYVARDRRGLILARKSFADDGAARAWISTMLADPKVLQVERQTDQAAPSTSAPAIAAA